MNIPHEIRVGPFTYRVDATADAIAAKRAEKGDAENICGYYETGKCLITIDPDDHPDCVRDTLLHEVLHIVVSMAGLDTSPRKLGDEEIVTRLTPLLLDTLRRNPDLVAFLTEGTWATDSSSGSFVACLFLAWQQSSRRHGCQ